MSMRASGKNSHKLTVSLINKEFIIIIIMVGMLAVVDRGFEPLSDQTKDYIIGICCFSAKHAALK